MRLDQRLVALGLAPSRTRAQALIAAGAVAVDGAPAAKPGQRVGAGARLSVADGPRWVGRGALKLAHALDVFGLDPAGAEALDVGASTGGFTQVLLRRGAARVHALDVGRGQLAAEVAADPRVVEVSGVNARDLDRAAAPFAFWPRFDWLVADVSFISLTLALDRPLAFAAPGATLVALVKPQFEAGRAAIGRGGLVRDPRAQAGAVARARAWLEVRGWRVTAETESPILGGDGNREWLLAARAPGE